MNALVYVDKFWRVSLEHFVELKPLISEEWVHTYVKLVKLTKNNLVFIPLNLLFFSLDGTFGFWNQHGIGSLRSTALFELLTHSSLPSPQLWIFHIRENLVSLVVNLGNCLREKWKFEQQSSKYYLLRDRIQMDRNKSKIDK